MVTAVTVTSTDDFVVFVGEYIDVLSILTAISNQRGKGKALYVSCIPVFFEAKAFPFLSGLLFRGCYSTSSFFGLRKEANDLHD